MTSMRRTESSELLIKETDIQRSMRRTSLCFQTQRASNKSNFFQSSIDIRQLFGSLYLNQEPIKSPELINVLLHKKKFFQRVRKASQNVQSYCNVFDTKAKLLVNILLDLITHYSFQIYQHRKNFKSLENLMKPWLETVQNTSFSYSDYQLRISQKLKERKVNKKQKAKVDEGDQLTVTCSNRGGRVSQILNIGLNNQRVRQRGNLVDLFSQDQDTQKAPSEEEKEKAQKSKEQFIKKIKLVLKKNELFQKQLKKWKIQLDSKLQNILTKGGFKENMGNLKEFLSAFQTGFSKIMRTELEGGRNFSDITTEKSLFILEFQICSKMKALWGIIDDKFISTLYPLSKEIDSSMISHSEFLKSKVKNLNSTGKLMYGKNLWNSDPIEHSIFKQPYQPINFFKIISPCYRKLMQKKLELPSNFCLINEDLIDFFKFYPFRYPTQSLLLVDYLKCTMKNNNRFILCLDIFSSVTLFEIHEASTTVILFRAVGGLCITEGVKDTQLVLTLNRTKKEKQKLRNKRNVIDELRVDCQSSQKRKDFLNYFYRLQKKRISFKTRMTPAVGREEMIAC